MNRAEFKTTLDRLEAFVNKIPTLPLEKRVELLSANDRDLSAVRRVGREGFLLKAPAERFYREARQYVRDPSDAQREKVLHELHELRRRSVEVEE
jgi:hypothetical protein